ncbi:MAG: ExbD/TolR family protein [Planctomycetota bacterium]|jgi:biopolymer transport protein ExbD
MKKRKGRDRRKKGSEHAGKTEAPELSMTPMIDVTFQLLIFFMVTSNFKSLEGKLDVFLPENGIRSDTPPVDMELPVRVVLRWNPSIGRCKFYVGQVLCNYDKQGLGRARTKVRKVLAVGARKAEIDASGDVPMDWVVRTLDMLVEADMPEINFTGAANPLPDNR